MRGPGQRQYPRKVWQCIAAVGQHQADGNGDVQGAVIDGEAGLLQPLLVGSGRQALRQRQGVAPRGRVVTARCFQVRRAGADVSLVTYGNSLPKCLTAADGLATEGISAEVIDLRVLRPLDMATVTASVARTRRVVIVDEGWKSGSISAEIAARLAEDALYELDAPVRRICSREVPVPYAAHLEEATLPRVDEIVSAARALVKPR